jgi:hypothetical protein
MKPIVSADHCGGLAALATVKGRTMPEAPMSEPIRQYRSRRRDTAVPNADVIRAHFAALGNTQAEFVAERGFTLRTFQRALAGVPISKIALRKMAEALSLPYEAVAVARSLHHPTHELPSVASPGLPSDSALQRAEERVADLLQLPAPLWEIVIIIKRTA